MSYLIETEVVDDFKLAMKTSPVRDPDPLIFVRVKVFSDGF